MKTTIDFTRKLFLFHKNSVIIIFSIFLLFLSEKSYSQKVVAGYYPDWKQGAVKIEDLHIEHLTHIIHSFGYPDTDGNIIIPDNFLYPELILKMHNAGKKVLFALGGGGQSGGFSSVVADDEKRDFFINNIIQFCAAYGYDGVDLDWEFPFSLTDKENLNKLVAGIKEKNPDLGITMAVSGGNYFSQHTDFTYLEPYVDWFGVMAYDMKGPWSATSGHHAPLYAPKDEVSADSFVKYLKNTRGVPPQKIVLGLPFYGYLFTTSGLGSPHSGATALSFIETIKKLTDGWEYKWDNFAKVPYLQNPGKTQLISYENTESVRLKCDYVNEKDLAGVMIWEISHDFIYGDSPLLENAGIKILGSLGNLTAEVTIESIDKGLKFAEGDTAIVSVNANDTTGIISKVELYIDNIKAAELTSAPYIFPVHGLEQGVHVLKAMAYNSLSVATPSDRILVRVTNDINSQQLPYNGIAAVIPGTVEAEEFDFGGEGISYHDTTPGNAAASYSDFRLDEDVDCEPMTEGEYNVGYIIDDEWLEYSVVIDSTAAYEITFNVASALSGGAFHLEIDSSNVTGTIETPGTGGWGTYVTISKTGVNLEAGEHILKFFAEKGDFNIDKMIFELQGVVGVDDDTGHIILRAG